MKIGIFGHSDAVYRKNKSIQTPNDIVAETFPDDQIDWFGVNYCSAERLLLILQKHKNYDFYLIFHTTYTAMFCPAWNKDAHVSDLRKCSRDPKFKESYLKVLEENLSTVSDVIFNEWVPDNKVLLNRWLGAMLQIKLFCSTRNTVHVDHYGNLQQYFSGFNISNQISQFVHTHRHNLDKSGYNEHYTLEEYYKNLASTICEEIYKFKQLSYS